MRIVSNIYWILGALLAAVFVRSFIFSVYKVPTQSMAPTLLAGDFILSSQLAYHSDFLTQWQSFVADENHSKPQLISPVVGDLIVLRFTANQAKTKSTAQYLKRVVAVAGDEIEIQQGRLIINRTPCTYVQKNDEELMKWLPVNHQIYTETCPSGVTHDVILNDQESLTQDSAQISTNYLKQKISEHQVYVISDNRLITDDSRNFGPVMVEQIASKVSLIWLSYGSTQDFISGSNQIRWNRILTKPL